MLTRRTTTIPIYQGDDSERLTELHLTYKLAERDATEVSEQYDAQEARVASDSARYDDDAEISQDDVDAAKAIAREAKKAYNDFVTEAADRALSVTVQHIGSKRFRELVAAHPQRVLRDDDGALIKDSEGFDIVHGEDFQFGVNTETMPRALLAYVDERNHSIRTITEPRLDGPQATEEFIDDELSDGDLDRIWRAAYFLNRLPSADPKALAFSPSIDEISE